MSSQGPHIGMYISAAQHRLLGWIFCQKSKIPYLSGYSLRRHHIGTVIMLPKKADLQDVKYLCTIVLLDLESNHTQINIEREAIQAVIHHKKIPPEQYSRPQHSFVAHGINHRLVFDYQRCLQTPFSIACSDLKICYDIIVRSASRLDLQHLGIPLPPIISMLDTIKCTSHRVGTAYGDSDLKYGVDTIPKEFKHFIMRLYQGNGCAPQLW